MGKVTRKWYSGEFKSQMALHAKIGELLVERDFLRDAFARLGVIRSGK
ncbi:hypothetical protein S101446_00180 [Komagataeibacter europaeus]|nr:hypothetical protein S101446_00180 [Komagataeibacter europaeus]